MPSEAKYRPQAVVDVIHSMPYTVGTAIAWSDVSLEDFSSQAIKKEGLWLEYQVELPT